MIIFDTLAKTVMEAKFASMIIFDTLAKTVTETKFATMGKQNIDVENAGVELFANIPNVKINVQFVFPYII